MIKDIEIYNRRWSQRETDALDLADLCAGAQHRGKASNRRSIRFGNELSGFIVSVPR